ncbi:MDR family MFS transporter [Lacibacterium aquatile]|uniref:MDR family MFS transporter n=1 Tax=Lacibacterium aquatile TaxID=1168082 RepID=A0ABW5DRX0_9PROT
MSSAAEAAPPPVALTPREIKVVLFGALLALFLAALDQTIVATALPVIGKDLGDFHLIGWIITSYMLTATAGTPILGKLGDLYGRRRLLYGCMVLFLIASVLCAISTTMVQLILARAVQGLAGGGLMTTVQALVGEIISPRERARYAAFFSMTWAAASLAGPILGGVFAAHVGWPWVFWINIPLGLAAMAVVVVALRKLPLQTRPARIDAPSILWLLVGSTTLLLAISEGGTSATWGMPVIAGLLVAGVGGLWFFFRRQTKVDEPILPPHFLTDRVIGPTLASIFIVFGAYLAVAVLAPTYLQVGLGATPDFAGLMMIPFMLSVPVTAFFGGQYVKKTGKYRLPVLVGIPFAVIALLIQAAFAGQLPAWLAALLLIPIGLGIGPIFPTTIVASQNAVAKRDLGAITGAFGFVRSLGGAVLMAGGTAMVLGLIAAWTPSLSSAGGLEGLARAALTPEDRLTISNAFGVLFLVTAVLMLVGLAVYARVEERPLRSSND